MNYIIMSLVVLGAGGCISCHQPQGPSAGIPLAGAMPASNVVSPGCEAIPAIGIGWETICLSIPKPRIFAVPKPMAAPQVFAIPMMPAAAVPVSVPGQMMVPQPAMVPHYNEPAQTPEPHPARVPSSCGDSCTDASDGNINKAEIEQCMRELSHEVAVMQERMNRRK